MRMSLWEFERYGSFLKHLKNFSDFDDDPVFTVKIKKKKHVILKEKVKAPNKVVLERAILRLSDGRIGDDEVEIDLVSPLN